MEHIRWVPTGAVADYGSGRKRSDKLEPRIASVLGGVCHLRRTEFAGRRPYHFNEPRTSASRRLEMWMDGVQASAARAERDGG